MWLIVAAVVNIIRHARPLRVFSLYRLSLSCLRFGLCDGNGILSLIGIFTHRKCRLPLVETAKSTL